MTNILRGIRPMLLVSDLLRTARPPGIAFADERYRS